MLCGLSWVSRRGHVKNIHVNKSFGSGGGGADGGGNSLGADGGVLYLVFQSQNKPIVQFLSTEHF